MNFSLKDDLMRDVARRIHLLSRDLSLIEQLQAPTIHHYVEAPIIDNWSIGARYEPALVGMVSGHPSRGDGPTITSRLYYLDDRIGVARTLSRWYRLGRRANSTEWRD